MEVPKLLKRLFGKDFGEGEPMRPRPPIIDKTVPYWNGRPPDHPHIERPLPTYSCSGLNITTYAGSE